MTAMSYLEKRFTEMQANGTVLHFIDDLCMASLLDSLNVNRMPSMINNSSSSLSESSLSNND